MKNKRIMNADIKFFGRKIVPTTYSITHDSKITKENINTLYDVIFDGRTSSGKWVKKVSKVLWYYFVPTITAIAVSYMIVKIFIGIGA